MNAFNSLEANRAFEATRERGTGGSGSRSQSIYGIRIPCWPSWGMNTTRCSRTGLGPWMFRGWICGWGSPRGPESMFGPCMPWLRCLPEQEWLPSPIDQFGVQVAAIWATGVDAKPLQSIILPKSAIPPHKMDSFHDYAGNVTLAQKIAGIFLDHVICHICTFWKVPVNSDPQFQVAKPTSINEGGSRGPIRRLKVIKPVLRWEGSRKTAGMEVVISWVPSTGIKQLRHRLGLGWRSGLEMWRSHWKSFIPGMDYVPTQWI